MSDEVVIKAEGVGKTFRLPHEKNSSVKGTVLNFYKGRRTYEKQQALKSISFEVKKGEFFGIVGRNGSGKSTLLKLLAGIYSPSAGSIQINGKLTPFIELGVGFNPELTGRENVFLNGALLGFNRKEMSAMYDAIVEFAELERFMDQKLKNYSSGMQVRLAFSIAIRAQSGILLIDEVLAVGDAAFQAKCFDYFYELKKRGTTVVFVSHDKPSLERFCESGILIDKGEIVTAGPIKDVLKSYSSVVLEELDKVETKEEKQKHIKASTYATIENVATYDKVNKPMSKFVYGANIEVRFDVKIHRRIDNPIIGLTVWQKNVDKPVFANNTLIDGKNKTGTYQKGDRITFRQTLPNLINDGEYFVEPAIANDSATVFYDQKPKATTFYIAGSDNPYSILATENHIILEKS